MKNFFCEEELRAQLRKQRADTWSFEDIDWHRGVNTDRYLLPLDPNHLGATPQSPADALALSQFLGLVVSATVAEMEKVASKWREVVWREPLKRYPVNPEIWELGELFFTEETKHAAAFDKYIGMFCEAAGIDPADLRQILPSVEGSLAEKMLVKNAKGGGSAFWWLVAIVEEASIEIYHAMHPFSTQLDPLYFEIHRKHLEDEVRHKSYAFYMLDVLRLQSTSLKRFVQRTADLAWAQLFVSTWTLANLEKIRLSSDLRTKHPFFDRLHNCTAGLNKLKYPEIIWNLFTRAPYVSYLLNIRWHKALQRKVTAHKMFQVPMPQPSRKQNLKVPA